MIVIYHKENITVRNIIFVLLVIYETLYWVNQMYKYGPLGNLFSKTAIALRLRTQYIFQSFF